MATLEELRAEDTLPAPGHRVIGTRPIRFDGVDRVTGRACYSADVKLPRMIPGRVLRSPHAHAHILSIDCSRAEALPGVVAVITARDIWTAGLDESVPLKLKQFRDHYLASDRVLYCGHPVAAVAAIDQYVAEEALGLIDVQYEILPPVLNARDAMKDSAPILHAEMKDRATGKPSNVARRVHQLKGNPDEGFAEAAVVVEREFYTSTVHQGYIEPPTTTAMWGPDGKLTLWSTTQAAFYFKDDAAKLLQIPASTVRVVPTEVGGAFGAKLVNYLEPLAALLSRKAGRPVRLSMTRAELLQATGPATASYIKVKMGATADGRLTAATAEIILEAGAFSLDLWAGLAADCIFSPYDIPHGRIDGCDVVVNKPRSGAYRGPGATQTAFACESVVDEICEKIGMDPLEFRLKNAAREGNRRIGGSLLGKVGYVETLQAAMSHPHYSSPLEGPNRGRGVACAWWPNFAMSTTCSLAVNSDGSVNLSMGAIDIGGGTRTVISMQAAEALELPLELIRPNTADTDAVGYTAETGGSNTTFSTGWSATLAARELIDKMRTRAAGLLGVEPADVTYHDGVFATTSTDKQLSFKELAAVLLTTGGPITATVSICPEGASSALGVQIADVEVDRETGKVTLLRYTAAQDLGKAIYPTMVEGQIQGGIAQGIGWALSEGYQFDAKGRLLNQSLLDYRQPTAADLPMIEPVIVEVPNPGHPFGIRGVGETPITAPPAALANAIHRAVGIRIRELPMNPERVLRELGVLGECRR